MLVEKFTIRAKKTLTNTTIPRFKITNVFFISEKQKSAETSTFHAVFRRFLSRYIEKGILAFTSLLIDDFFQKFYLFCCYVSYDENIKCIGSIINHFIDQ